MLKALAPTGSNPGEACCYRECSPHTLTHNFADLVSKAAKLMFIGLTNLFDQSEPAVYFHHGNSLKYAYVHEQ